MMKYFLILGAAQLLIWAIAPKAKAEGLSVLIKREPAAVQAYKSADILNDETPQIIIVKKQFAAAKAVQAKGQ